MARVLVVDDNLSILQALKYFLEAVGYDVVLAADGRTALRLAAEQEIDIILLDIEMPEVSGKMVCKAIQESPALRHLPVVLMTGKMTRPPSDPAELAGAREIMIKPFDLEQLNLVLSRHLPIVQPP